MVTMSDRQKQFSSKFGFGLFGTIATLSMTIWTIGSFVLFSPSQSVQASQDSAIAIAKQKQSVPKTVKITGTYKVYLSLEILANARKEGIVSISGQWIIKPNRKFEAVLKSVSEQGKVETISTTGTVKIVDGKVVSQVETFNGKKPNANYPTQSYTLLEDGKTLQADGQPVKLVRQ